MDAPGLLEREELLEQLSSHATAAARGSGSMVFVGGEAGAGKTSLVEALRTLLHGTAFHCGYCDPLSAPRPLASLLDIAPHLAQEVRDLMAASGDRHELFTAFLDGLVHKHVPRVIVFEDVHWADDATLDLLRFVGRRIAESRSLVLATYRDDEVGAAHPVRRLLGDLGLVAGIFRLSVPPLSLEAVRSLVGDSGREPEQVHGRTGGNPYFVAEVLGMDAPAGRCHSVKFQGGIAAPDGGQPIFTNKGSTEKGAGANREQRVGDATAPNIAMNHSTSRQMFRILEQALQLDGCQVMQQVVGDHHIKGAALGHEL